MEEDAESAELANNKEKETLTKVEVEMKEIVSIFFRSLGEAEKTQNEEWDGMLASVSRETYPIALWNLLTENIRLLW